MVTWKRMMSYRGMLWVGDVECWVSARLLQASVRRQRLMWMSDSAGPARTARDVSPVRPIPTPEPRLRTPGICEEDQ